jgi:hypothetical protein
VPSKHIVGGVDMERECVVCKHNGGACDTSSVHMHVEGVPAHVGIEGMHVDTEAHGGVEACVCVWWATAWARTCA